MAVIGDERDALTSFSGVKLEDSENGNRFEAVAFLKCKFYIVRDVFDAGDDDGTGVVSVEPDGAVHPTDSSHDSPPS